MRSDQPQTKPCAAGRQFPVRTRYKVLLGPLCLELCSNEPEFRGGRFFPLAAWAASDSVPDYTVNLCNLNFDGPWPEAALRESATRCYRANRFAAGYYLTDHFGKPAHWLLGAAEHWIFAHDFEPILWPCVVKYLLTIFSIERGLLHLKAASLAVDGRGTLLVARGGGGKTLLLAQLCQSGAEFLSNTHSLLHANEILPVATSLRVRNDITFGPLIASGALSAAIKPGEFTADPIGDLGWRTRTKVPAHHLCLVDYRIGRRVIREMDPEQIFDYMEQFALALNVYGLKEDVLDFLGGDVSEFSRQISAMRRQLRMLVDGCRAHYISCDSTELTNRRQILNLLAQ